jgi:hypothetical protein
VIGKFALESNPVMFTGILVLAVASAWNMCPLPAVKLCSCQRHNASATSRSTVAPSPRSEPTPAARLRATDPSRTRPSE